MIFIKRESSKKTSIKECKKQERRTLTLSTTRTTSNRKVTNPGKLMIRILQKKDSHKETHSKSKFQ